jgi:predicted nucleotidyltransferase
LAEAHGARNVFGSVVRGDNGQESDVDFLVEFEEGRTLLDLIGLKWDLQDLLDDFRAAHPAIPWREMNDLRNVLIHLIQLWPPVRHWPPEMP